MSFPLITTTISNEKKNSQFPQSHKHIFNPLKIKFEESKGRDRSLTHITAGSNFHKEKSVSGPRTTGIQEH